MLIDESTTTKNGLLFMGGWGGGGADLPAVESLPCKLLDALVGDLLALRLEVGLQVLQPSKKVAANAARELSSSSTFIAGCWLYDGCRYLSHLIKMHVLYEIISIGALELINDKWGGGGGSSVPQKVKLTADTPPPSPLL